MIYDSDKTIKIPVTVKNGAVIFPDDFNLNSLRKDFHAEIVLNEADFIDKTLFYSVSKQSIVEFLPINSRLLVNVRLKELIFDDLRKDIITKDSPQGIGGGFVEIFLREPQLLKLRGTKKSQLLSCAIGIPALSIETASSLNHAYTLISQAFEPWRISHAGNVFSKIYWRENEESRWRPLDARRKQIESKMAA